ncbi:MAG: class I SAM-dependent methyltransferase [Flavobacteriia bacterium]|nr:class I SAM-dependent methyltransferase [Flavobacteriia bacterium]
MKKNIEWFAEWFDSRYYHVLYQHRDEQEAGLFINQLMNVLKLHKGSKVLDIACGKGRHALMFNALGFDTYGADLSENSILEAKKQQKENLSFFVQDMRDEIPINNFDLVCNLFTSFGYFEQQKENELVLKNIYSSLKKSGYLVIDFLNSVKVCKNLPQKETKTCNGIEFKIEKFFDSNHIYKNIFFTDNGKEYSFQEKVQNLSFSDFEKLLFLQQFKIEHIFGSYQLQTFNSNQSDRLIIIAKK